MRDLTTTAVTAAVGRFLAVVSTAAVLAQDCPGGGLCPPTKQLQYGQLAWANVSVHGPCDGNRNFPDAVGSCQHGLTPVASNHLVLEESPALQDAVLKGRADASLGGLEYHLVELNEETGQAEDWSEIAASHGIPLKRLLAYNGLQESDAQRFAQIPDHLPNPTKLGTYVVVGGRELIEPQCGCSAEFPNNGNDGMSCAHSQFQDIVISRLCSNAGSARLGAHPASFVTSQDFDYWEAQLPTDGIVGLYIMFAAKSQIHNVVVDFGSSLPPWYLLESVLVEVDVSDDLASPDFQPWIQFKRNPDEECVAADSLCFDLPDGTSLAPDLGPGVLSDPTQRVRVLFSTNGDRSQAELNSEALHLKVTDIVFEGRHACNGHAATCFAETEDSPPVCQCEHNTQGPMCERCLDRFNNKPYAQGKTCERCNCNRHDLTSGTCVYDATLGEGRCVDCEHNTAGDHCEQCQNGFFRNVDAAGIYAPDTCAECQCNYKGSVDATCVAHTTESDPALGFASSDRALGQCTCLKNVDPATLKCDKCLPEAWDFGEGGDLGCRSCTCNVHGTVTGTNTCDDITGECACKDLFEPPHCEVCAKGYYAADSDPGTCVECNPLDPPNSTAPRALYRRYDADTNECSLCDPQCAYGCTGPTASECLACRNFHDTATGECVASCPAGTYTDANNAAFFAEFVATVSGALPPQNVSESRGNCRPCSEDCKGVPDATCSGPGSFEGQGGCKECAVLTASDGRCISENTCPPGQYLEFPGFSKGCLDCNVRCNQAKQCSGPLASNCDSCKFVVLEAPPPSSCPEGCPSGTFEFFDNETAGTTFCVECSALCSSALGCTNPLLEIGDPPGLDRADVRTFFGQLTELSAASCTRCGAGTLKTTFPAGGFDFAPDLLVSRCIEGVSECTGSNSSDSFTFTEEGSEANGFVGVCSECDPQCSVGCSGGGPDQCAGSGGVAHCRNFIDPELNECVSDCPPPSTGMDGVGWTSAGSWSQQGGWAATGVKNHNHCFKCHTECSPNATVDGTSDNCAKLDDATACAACRTIKHEGKCVSKCPDKYFEVAGPADASTCALCKFRVGNVTGPCAETCPVGTYEDPDGELCIHCDKHCRVDCDGPGPRACTATSGATPCKESAIFDSSCETPQPPFTLSCRATCVGSCASGGFYGGAVCYKCPADCTLGGNGCCLGVTSAADLPIESIPGKTCGFRDAVTAEGESACIKCHDMCLGCSGDGTFLDSAESTGGCSKCAHYELETVETNGRSSTTCVADCPPTHFRNNVLGKCSKCSAACDLTTGTEACTTSGCKKCAYGSFRGECVLKCPPGTVPIEASEKNPDTEIVCAECNSGLRGSPLSFFDKGTGECDKLGCHKKCTFGCTGRLPNECTADCTSPLVYPDGLHCRPCHSRCKQACRGPLQTDCEDTTVTTPTFTSTTSTRTFASHYYWDAAAGAKKPCDPQCLTSCSGPGANQCIAPDGGKRRCTNVDLLDTQGRSLRCVVGCPAGTYLVESDVPVCVPDCASYGQRLQALFETRDQKSMYTDSANQKCGVCDVECFTCTGPGPEGCVEQPQLCMNVFDAPSGLCRAACETGNRYEEVRAGVRTRDPAVYDGKITFCEACHPLCDQSKGCSGPGADQCTSCVGLSAPHPDGTAKRVCVEECGALLFEERARCQNCHPACRFDCESADAWQCTLPGAIPLAGKTFIYGQVLLKGAGDLVLDKQIRFEVTRGLLAVTSPTQTAVTSMESTPAGALVHFKSDAAAADAELVVQQSSAMADGASRCTAEGCLIVEVAKHAVPQGKYDGMHFKREGSIAVQEHVSRCKAGWAEEGSTCKKQCSDRYFTETKTVVLLDGGLTEGTYCGECHDSCPRCSGPTLADCLGECIVFDEGANKCAQYCGGSEYVFESRVGRTCQPCHELCKAGTGCKGAGADQCNECATAELDGVCYSSCPGLQVGKSCVYECPGYQLESGACVGGDRGCPDGTALLPGTKVCAACHEECRMGCDEARNNKKCRALQVGTELRKCKSAVDRDGTCLATCPVGSFYQMAGQTATVAPEYGGFLCRLCDTGYSCADGIIATVCPAGTFTDVVGSDRCYACPANAVCDFNFAKGARDSFVCDSGFTRKEKYQGVTLVKYCSDGSSGSNDDELHVMIGVVAGCAVVIAFGTALFCSMKQQAYRSEVAAYAVSRQYDTSLSLDQSMISVVSRTPADYAGSETRI